MWRTIDRQISGNTDCNACVAFILHTRTKHKNQLSAPLSREHERAFSVSHSYRHCRRRRRLENKVSNTT